MVGLLACVTAMFQFQDALASPVVKGRPFHRIGSIGKQPTEEKKIATPKGDARPSAHSVLQSIVEARTWSERSKFLLLPDIQDTQEISLDDLPPIERFESDHPATLGLPGDEILAADSLQAGAAPIIARFVAAPSGALKLDWRLFVQSSSGALESFCFAPQEAGVFLVKAQRIENPYGNFEPIAISEPGGTRILTRLAVEKNSLLAERLNHVLEPECNRLLMTSVAWSEKPPRKLQLLDFEPVGELIPAE